MHIANGVTVWFLINSYSSANLFVYILTSSSKTFSNIGSRCAIHWFSYHRREKNNSKVENLQWFYFKFNVSTYLFETTTCNLDYHFVELEALSVCLTLCIFRLTKKFLMQPIFSGLNKNWPSDVHFFFLCTILLL